MGNPFLVFLPNSILKRMIEVNEFSVSEKLLDEFLKKVKWKEVSCEQGKIGKDFFVIKVKSRYYRSCLQIYTKKPYATFRSFLDSMYFTGEIIPFLLMATLKEEQAKLIKKIYTKMLGDWFFLKLEGKLYVGVFSDDKTTLIMLPLQKAFFVTPKYFEIVKETQKFWESSYTVKSTIEYLKKNRPKQFAIISDFLIRLGAKLDALLIFSGKDMYISSVVLIKINNVISGSLPNKHPFRASLIQRVAQFFTSKNIRIAYAGDPILIKGEYNGIPIEGIIAPYADQIKFPKVQWIKKGNIRVPFFEKEFVWKDESLVFGERITMYREEFYHLAPVDGVILSFNKAPTTIMFTDYNAFLFKGNPIMAEGKLFVGKNEERIFFKVKGNILFGKNRFSGEIIWDTYSLDKSIAEKVWNRAREKSLQVLKEGKEIAELSVKVLRAGEINLAISRKGIIFFPGKRTDILIKMINIPPKDMTAQFRTLNRKTLEKVLGEKIEKVKLFYLKKDGYFLVAEGKTKKGVFF